MNKNNNGNHNTLIPRLSFFSYSDKICSIPQYENEYSRLKIDNTMRNKVNQERFEAISSRSEIGSIPETEEQIESSLVHFCNNCNKEYFCPDLTVEDNSKCDCQHMVCFICFNDVC